MPTKTTIDFDTLEVGYTFPAVTVDIDQQVIDVAALAHLDFNPVHTNVPWAERAQVFGTPRTVAHGMFSMSQLVSVVLRHWQEANVTIVGTDAKLIRPVPVGSIVESKGEIRELHPRAAGEHIVVVGVEGVNQDGLQVAVGNVTVRIGKE